MTGLYRTRMVRFMAIDSVGDVEDNTYTIPTGLFTFRQEEWPVTLYFPAARACPSLVPEKVLDVVLTFQALTVTKRYPLGDRKPGEPEPEDLTSKARQDLSDLLGVKSTKARAGKTKSKKKKTGQSSAAGITEVDLEEEVDI